jgi:hypothetical protein
MLTTIRDASRIAGQILIYLPLKLHLYETMRNGSFKSWHTSIESLLRQALGYYASFDAN